MGGKAVKLFSDSRLVVSQVTRELEARDPRMQGYLDRVRRMRAKFESFDVLHIPRGENTHANSLATLATSSVRNFPRVIIVEDLCTPTSPEKEMEDRSFVYTVDEALAAEAAELMLISFSLFLLTIEANGWRSSQLSGHLEQFLRLHLLGLAPESPRYLCMKGNTTDALRILEKMAQLNQRKLPSGLLVSTKTDRKDEEFSPTEEVLLLSSTKKNTESFLDFCYHLSAIIVDRVGRKLSFIIMLTLVCIFLLPLVFHQSAVLTTGLLFGARMCSMGSITVAYIYGPEIYPTSMRTTGTGIASSTGRIGGMICPLVAVGLVTGCHQTTVIILFEVVIVLSAICAFLFPVETKGQELSDTIGVSKSKEVLVVGD
ncbi:organic cation/carnitine transporter 7-like [Quercus lobata]|uniref:organic cation/carnitine transporter 7-like n=1 Tax=Quercus lobata TaxID=97700 RepID=UPI0012484EC3|nr:organic cation/carnitine transporter 7-like [Quercus lobata]